MKIALIGYGKMGKTIEQIAISHGHEIVARLDNADDETWEQEGIKSADVAIEFSQPESAFENILRCFEVECSCRLRDYRMAKSISGIKAHLP